MIEYLVGEELYNQLSTLQLEYGGNPVSLQVWRAKQSVKEISYPCIFIDYLDPVIDKSNTPLNEILRTQLIDAEDGYKDISYTKGARIRQSIDLNLYDDNIKRIAKLQNDLFLWAKRDLSITDVVVFQVNPPRILDFTEEDYVYRRMIEVIAKYEISWSELIKTIEEVETSVEVES
jgi:hypothetical protein